MRSGKPEGQDAFESSMWVRYRKTGPRNFLEGLFSVVAETVYKKGRRPSHRLTLITPDSEGPQTTVKVRESKNGVRAHWRFLPKR